MITVRAMQVKDAEQVSELERMIFSQPWSYQGFVDSLSLPNTVFLVAEENNILIYHRHDFLFCQILSASSAAFSKQFFQSFAKII